MAHLAFVAQLAARGSHNPKVAGSTPVESIFWPKWWFRWDSNPRPQDGLELESSALDHSATKPTLLVQILITTYWSCGAMDSAPDFESGGWGFESLQDRFANQRSAIGLVVKYLVANEVPRVRFPDGAYLARVAQLVAPRSYVPMVQGSSPCTSIFWASGGQEGLYLYRIPYL